MSGAKEVDRRGRAAVVNVVQEMAIAANIPPPRVYLIEDTAPNAFATGRDPKHATVAITTGLFDKLDREELQGVIGHELSHIRNLDIRFSLLVGVLVGSIALMSDFFLRHVLGRRPPSSRGRGSSEGGLASSFSRSRSCWQSSRRSWPAGPAGGQPAARVPRGRIGGRADA